MKRGGDLHVSDAWVAPVGRMRQTMGHRDDDRGAHTYDDSSAVLGVGGRDMRRAHRGGVYNMARGLLKDGKKDKKIPPTQGALNL
jgi:hypothetical protein